MEKKYRIIISIQRFADGEAHVIMHGLYEEEFYKDNIVKINKEIDEWSAGKEILGRNNIATFLNYPHNAPAFHLNEY